MLWAGGRLSTGSGRRKQGAGWGLSGWSSEDGAERRLEQEFGASLMAKMLEGGFRTSLVDSQEQREGGTLTALAVTERLLLPSAHHAPCCAAAANNYVNGALTRRFCYLILTITQGGRCYHFYLRF